MPEPNELWPLEPAHWRFGWTVDVINHVYRPNNDREHALMNASGVWGTDT